MILNKRPIGHNAHLRKLLENRYICVLNGSSFEQTWIPFTQGGTVAGLVEISPVVLEKILKFCQCIFDISPWKNAGPFIWTKLNPHHPMMPCAKFSWNWSSGSWVDFLCQCIFAILKLSPLGKGRGSSFEQTWILLTQGCFVPSLVEIGSVVLEKKIFKFRKCIFAIS